MSKTREQGKAEVAALCEYFANNRDAFTAPGVKEAHVRQSLIDPFFEALGWNVRNSPPVAPQYREVVPEDSIEVEGRQKAPDYTFRVGIYYMQNSNPPGPISEFQAPLAKAYGIASYHDQDRQQKQEELWAAFRANVEQ